LVVRDDGVAEQVEYYRRRAPVYDQWWARRGSYALPPQLHRQWFEDVAEIEQVVHDFAPTGARLGLDTIPLPRREERVALPAGRRHVHGAQALLATRRARA
jgi:hypothetical protein